MSKTLWSEQDRSLEFLRARLRGIRLMITELGDTMKLENYL